MGKGEAFSPTDLVGTALGTCILTIMGIVAERHNIDLRGATCTVVKEMVTHPLRRIGKLSVTFNVPARLSEEDKQRLQNAAYTCPVTKSLHPDVQVPIVFNFGE
jgi:putative redox protein